MHQQARRRRFARRPRARARRGGRTHHLTGALKSDPGYLAGCGTAVSQCSALAALAVVTWLSRIGSCLYLGCAALFELGQLEHAGRQMLSWQMDMLGQDCSCKGGHAQEALRCAEAAGHAGCAALHTKVAPAVTGSPQADTRFLIADFASACLLCACWQRAHGSCM